MNNLRTWEAILVASQIGFVFAASVVIGLLAGRYLDAVANTSPLFLLVGVVAGTAAGISGVLQIIKYMQRRNDKSR